MIIAKIKEKIYIVLNKIHLWIFKVEMGPETARFAKNIGYMSFGTIGYTAILFIANFSVIRFFGPEEYGKYILLFSIVSLLTMPMYFGLHTSLTKFLPENDGDENGQKKISATAISLAILLTVICAAIYIFFSDTLANQLKVSASLFILAITYSVFAVFKGLADALLKGLKEFREQAKFALYYAVVILALFFILWFCTGSRSYTVYAGSIIAGIIFYSLFVFIKYRKRVFPLSYDRAVGSKLLNYGFFSTIGALSWAIIGTSDRFFLNNLSDAKIVGIYAAYYGASMLITSRALGVFLNVFFPTVAGIKDKKIIGKKLNKMMLVSAIPIFLLNCITIFAAIFLYGESYPLNFGWMAAFSISSVIFTFSSIRWNLVAAEGVVSMRYCAIHSIICIVINLASNALLVARFNVLGAVFASVISSTYLLAVSALYFYKYEQTRT